MEQVNFNPGIYSKSNKVFGFHRALNVCKEIEQLIQ